MKMPDSRIRCPWPGEDPLMIRYHDEEWGVPVHDDRKWFEFLVLDAFQAGLSWRIILYKRDALRKVFHGFDPAGVAEMGEAEIAAACQDARIIRNRLKIRAAVENARAFLMLQKAHGTFDAFIWQFTKGKTVHHRFKRIDLLPAATPLSHAVSKALKKEGFKFVGSTICYAFLQAGGIVNDHLVDCFRYAELKNGSPSAPPAPSESRRR